jgi:hypothetical protein
MILSHVTSATNGRSRKRLNFLTPEQALNTYWDVAGINLRPDAY